MSSSLQLRDLRRYGLEIWVRLKVHAVITAHKDLSIDGWEERYQPRRKTPLEHAEGRTELVGRGTHSEVVAAALAVIVNPMPWNASAYWVAHQAEQIHGSPVRLGAAIAGAIVAGYEPMRDTVGPGCGFRKRVFT